MTKTTITLRQVAAQARAATIAAEVTGKGDAEKASRKQLAEQHGLRRLSADQKAAMRKGVLRGIRAVRNAARKREQSASRARLRAEQAQQRKHAASTLGQIEMLFRHCAYRGATATAVYGDRASVAEDHREATTRLRRGGFITGDPASNDVTITVRKSWRRTVVGDSIAVAAGMLTVDAKRVPREQLPPGLHGWEAQWIRQGPGYHVVSEHGWIFRDHDWHLDEFPWTAGIAVHVGLDEARTLRAAVKLAQRRLAARRGVQPSGPSKPRSPFAGFRKADLDVVVAVADSINAGNCASGTAHWVAMHLPGRESATVRELLQIAHDTGDEKRLVRLACRAAIRRAAAGEEGVA